ncbi:hypothetical protein DSCW_07580 [Desulfosarcina widdelii]|uniref:Uncharacterized protein n=1 Tax=Desulfosarcina widdelii TaxID=947919 RepID=A0A5K7Z1H1_9BACT|nr:hypothetical protein DSCW_07580 [Desulfosarcina widdelii]
MSSLKLKSGQKYRILPTFPCTVKIKTIPGSVIEVRCGPNTPVLIDSFGNDIDAIDVDNFGSYGEPLQVVKD